MTKRLKFRAGAARPDEGDRLTTEDLRRAMGLMWDQPHAAQTYLHHPRCRLRDQPVHHVCELDPA